MRELPQFNEDFEYNGKWFLPDDEGYVASGKLSYSNGHLEIKIDQIPINQDEIEKMRKHPLSNEAHFNTLLGISDYGWKITLQGLHQYHQSIGGHGIAHHTASYSIFKAIIGKHFKDESEMKFKQVSVSYSNFKAWVGRTGVIYNINPKSPFSYSMNYKRPNLEKGKANKIFDYSIQTNASIKSSYGVIGPVKENFMFSLHAKSNEHYCEFEKIHNRIHNFLIFCVGYPIFPLSIDVTDGSLQDSIRIYYSANHPKHHKRIENNQMFLPFFSISKSFETNIQNWLKSYESNEEPYDLYFKIILDDGYKIKNRFEDMVKVVEGYHRSNFIDELMEKCLYKEMIAEILLKVKNSKWQSDWVNYQKTNGNYISLSGKLHQLFALVPYLFPDDCERGKFISKIVKIRNSIVHQTSSAKEYTDSEILNSTDQLQILFVSCLCSELGFDEKYLQSIILEYNKRYRDLGFKQS